MCFSQTHCNAAVPVLCLYPLVVVVSAYLSRHIVEALHCPHELDGRVIVSLCAGLHLLQLTLSPRRQTIEIQSFVCHGNLLSDRIYFTR